MGSLQSILGDCQIGQMPTYMKDLVTSGGGGGGGGDETYMVYGDQLPFQRDAKHGAREGGGGGDDDNGRGGDDSELYYSGPSQKHVRANLLEEQKQQQQRQVLADLVDLCVDGVDSAEVRGRMAPRGGAGVPGGQTYSAPRGGAQNGQFLNTEIWDEAEHRAKENGHPVRVSPGGEGEGEGETPAGAARAGASAAASSAKKSKKKHKKKKSSKRAPELIHDDENGKESHDLVDTEQREYESESEQQVPVPGPISVDAGPAGAVGQAPPGPPSTPKNAGPGSKHPVSPPRSPVSIKVCREEESRLLEKLTVVVHPSEEPDHPPECWCLLEADWFREWSAFLRGAPRPGRINNGKLLNAAAGNEPWPGLLPGKHYVGLDQLTWSLLREIYSADVEIVRPLFDIYSAPPVA